MGKIHELKLKLPNPCQEDFFAMRKTQGGSFCGSCRKVIVDFSVMSDQQLLDHISNAAQGICGRFSASQLNRYISNEPRSTAAHFPHAVIFTALLAVPFPAFSKDASAAESASTIDVPSKPKPAGIKLRGKVFDRESKSGIHVTIRLADGAAGSVILDSVVSDSSGLFEIKLPASYRQIFFSLLFEDINYQERKVVVDRRKLPQFLQVSLQRLTTVTVTAPPLQHLEPVYEIPQVHYMGIPQMDFTVEVRPRGLKRIPYFLKRTFRKMQYRLFYR